MCVELLDNAAGRKGGNIVLDVKNLDKELALRVRLDYGEKSKIALGTAKVCNVNIHK